MFPWFIGLNNSGDGVQNLVPRVPYGAPTLMVTLHGKLANFEGPGSLWVGAERKIIDAVFCSALELYFQGVYGSGGGGCDE